MRPCTTGKNGEGDESNESNESQMGAEALHHKGEVSLESCGLAARVIVSSARCFYCKLFMAHVMQSMEHGVERAYSLVAAMSGV